MIELVSEVDTVPDEKTKKEITAESQIPWMSKILEVKTVPTNMESRG